MFWWAVLPQWHVIVILSVRPCVCVCVFHTNFSATVNSKYQKHLAGIMIIHVHVYRSSIFAVSIQGFVIYMCSYSSLSWVFFAVSIQGFVIYMCSYSSLSWVFLVIQCPVKINILTANCFQHDCLFCTTNQTVSRKNKNANATKPSNTTCWTACN